MTEGRGVVALPADRDSPSRWRQSQPVETGSLSHLEGEHSPLPLQRDGTYHPPSHRSGAILTIPSPTGVRAPVSASIPSLPQRDTTCYPLPIAVGEATRLFPRPPKWNNAYFSPARRKSNYCSLSRCSGRSCSIKYPLAHRHGEAAPANIPSPTAVGEGEGEGNPTRSLAPKQRWKDPQPAHD